MAGGRLAWKHEAEKQPCRARKEESGTLQEAVKATTQAVFVPFAFYRSMVATREELKKMAFDVVMTVESRNCSSGSRLSSVYA